MQGAFLGKNIWATWFCYFVKPDGKECDAGEDIESELEALIEKDNAPHGGIKRKNTTEDPPKRRIKSKTPCALAVQLNYSLHGCQNTILFVSFFS